jgi:hypothetical protein
MCTSCPPVTTSWPTIRRRGSSIYDQIDSYDMTTDEVYFERGVSRRHGFLTEFYVDEPE